MTSTWLVILLIIIACCVVGFPFTWIYWKQADKWASAEASRAEASRQAALARAQQTAPGVPEADRPKAEENNSPHTPTPPHTQPPPISR